MNYIKNHFEDIMNYASVIENRLNDDCTIDNLLQDNMQLLELCKKHNANYVLIDNEYKIDIDF